MTNPNFSNSFGRVAGSNTISVAGIEFQFTPSIAMTAKHLFALEKSIKSFRVPLETSIREVMRPSIATNFTVGGRPQWVPLAESTVKRKGNFKVNVDSGKLAKKAAQRNIWTVGRSSAIIAGGKLIGDVPYALYVQAGHSGGTGQNISIPIAAAGNRRQLTINTSMGKSTPARPYLMIQEEDKAKIATIFSEWIAMRIAQKWGS